jgi:hypothetical protein
MPTIDLALKIDKKSMSTEERQRKKCRISFQISVI